MTRLVTAICAAVVALTGLARPAEANPVVVELFTSQGCSSCPPAEELLGRIADRDEVLALSLHVDYWDYLGWKDEYALKDCTRRQRGYARAAGRNMVYTPQMIVNGREALTGTDTMELAELIMKYQHPGRDAAQVEVVARRTGNALSVEVAPREGAAGKRADLVVQLVQYVPRASADITKGENAGRRTNHYNVVRDWRVLGRWDGTAPLRLEADLTDGLRAAVIVQQTDYGPIVAAARAD
ncbi:DUF1223 domain-containing protein [Jhaorihella thermophila]|uniref:DUF1223 domain-containing protein n=1 Tax=Jhaorihella thermophila TaxID=488547 RepID=A0A1H5XWD8_9RHOB|nr:DUF1223 domain-containing protein [Jhaorihella thermophila]SEG15988.1 hypothetical protein SAMN05421751_11321 [Jhaorihella thermophila]